MSHFRPMLLTIPLLVLIALGMSGVSVAAAQDAGTPVASSIEPTLPGDNALELSPTLESFTGMPTSTAVVGTAGLPLPTSVPTEEIALEAGDISVASANCSVAPERDLVGADLSGCDLTAATLDGRDLTGADLSYAILTAATLNGANLSNVNFTCAILTAATLNGANLTGANFSGANLTSATLDGVTYSGTVCPDGSNSDNNAGTCTDHLTPVGCDAATSTAAPTATDVPSTATETTAGSTGTAVSTATGEPAGRSTPTVPLKLPNTGSNGESSGGLPFALLLVLLGGAASATALLGLHRTRRVA